MLPLPITSDATGLEPVCLLNGQEEHVDVAESYAERIAIPSWHYSIGSTFHFRSNPDRAVAGWGLVRM
jgi:hypothetical protein